MNETFRQQVQQDTQESLQAISLLERGVEAICQAYDESWGKPLNKALYRYYAVIQYLQDDESADLMDNAYADLLRQYDKKALAELGLRNMSFVLLGSRARGGARVRKMRNTMDNCDIEIGLLVDYDSSQEFEPLRNITAPLPSDSLDMLLSSSFQDNRIELDDKLTPRFVRMENLHSVEDATLLLQTAVDNAIHSDLRDMLIERMHLYFLPSFPQQENIRNMQYVLQAMQTIWKESQDEWQIIIQALHTSFKRIGYPLKRKHFYSQEKEEYPEELDRAIQAFNQNVENIFFAMLESTKE